MKMKRDSNCWQCRCPFSEAKEFLLFARSQVGSSNWINCKFIILNEKRLVNERGGAWDTRHDNQLFSQLTALFSIQLSQAHTTSQAAASQRESTCAINYFMFLLNFISPCISYARLTRTTLAYHTHIGGQHDDATTFGMIKWHSVHIFGIGNSNRDC